MLTDALCMITSKNALEGFLILLVKLNFLLAKYIIH